MGRIKLNRSNPLSLYAGHFLFFTYFMTIWLPYVVQLDSLWFLFFAKLIKSKVESTLPTFISYMLDIFYFYLLWFYEYLTSSCSEFYVLYILCVSVKKTFLIYNNYECNFRNYLDLLLANITPARMAPTCRDDTAANTMPICTNFTYQFEAMKRSIKRKVTPLPR